MLDVRTEAPLSPVYISWFPITEVSPAETSNAARWAQLTHTAVTIVIAVSNHEFWGDFLCGVFAAVTKQYRDFTLTFGRKERTVTRREHRGDFWVLECSSSWLLFWLCACVHFVIISWAALLICTLFFMCVLPQQKVNFKNTIGWLIHGKMLNFTSVFIRALKRNRTNRLYIYLSTTR